MSSDSAHVRGAGIRKTLLLGIAGLGLLFGAAVAIAHFTRPSAAARESARPRVAAAEPRAFETTRERKLEALERRLAQLELAERMQQAAPDSSAAPTEERQQSPLTSASIADVEQRVHKIVERMEDRFSSQGARSDWGQKKEQDLRASIGGLKDEQAARIRSLDCHESMCRLEVEHESSTQAMAFLDEMERRPGMLGAHSTRLRPNLNEERYVFYIEPRIEPSHVTMNH
jgi:hypothetical protein